ncbi:MAG TPA: LD-carboxypeptidase [Ignavibacteriaceae bacterium]|jgi:muramoyltetrapeptide carboxypeptidase
MKRRNFLKTISTAVIAATASPSQLNSSTPVSDPLLKLVKPQRLNAGDTVALVTPGSYITQQEKEDSINNLSELGFKVVHSDRLIMKNGYFSATDAERAEDLNDMFRRDDVNGIFCARGGYGCARILPYLDYRLMNQNPKPLIGFSDITALQFALFKYGRLTTYHGPVAISSFSRYSKECFEKVLMSDEKEIELQVSSSGNNYNVYGVTSISDGITRGELVGGNLTIVASLIGTPYDIDTKGKIIFLEEFLEEPYRVDRMLTQMIQAGKFKDAAGIALGVFKLCEPNSNNPAFAGSFSLMEVLKDRLGGLGIPVIYGLSFGHVVDKITLPFGINAELNTYTQTIKLLEQTVL